MIAIISLVAFFASILTFFTGFGLGTILMPVMALFFPVFIAVSITAIVHLLNNIFKLVLLIKHIDYKIVIRFGLPALLSSALGAYLLILISKIQFTYQYNLFDIKSEVTLIKLVIGFLLIGFAIAEFISVQNKIKVADKWLPLGGFLSGFFGGLSGHQGALRSVFLVHTKLDKTAFIATNSAIASIVDISRIVVYGLNFSVIKEQENLNLILVVCFAAFAGALLGRFLLKKITIDYIQKIIAIMLLIIGTALIIGLI